MFNWPVTLTAITEAIGSIPLLTDGSYQWWYYYYTTSPFATGSNHWPMMIRHRGQLRLGDFDGDGVTDVFKLVRQCTPTHTPTQRLRSTPTPTLPGLYTYTYAWQPR